MKPSSIRELKAIAKEMKLSKYSSLKKAELFEYIQQNLHGQACELTCEVPTIEYVEGYDEAVAEQIESEQQEYDQLMQEQQELNDKEHEFLTQPRLDTVCIPSRTSDVPTTTRTQPILGWLRDSIVCFLCAGFLCGWYISDTTFRVLQRSYEDMCRVRTWYQRIRRLYLHHAGRFGRQIDYMLRYWRLI